MEVLKIKDLITTISKQAVYQISDKVCKILSPFPFFSLTNHRKVENPFSGRSSSLCFPLPQHPTKNLEHNLPTKLDLGFSPFFSQSCQAETVFSYVCFPLLNLLFIFLLRSFIIKAFRVPYI